MIFKTLFTPAHKHADPAKRQASIEKLDPSKENDKRILHELAFNDASDSVSLAALNKLDSFVLWMKSVETSASPVIKKKAENVCIDALEDENVVDQKMFESFVLESKNKSMLSTLLFSSKRLQQDDSLSYQVLISLSNEQAVRRFFAERANESQQLNIVKDIQDPKLLSKFSKQTSYQSVLDVIDEKAKQAELAKLMPAKVKHAVTLINSRMLALKESQDYTYVEQEFTKLNKEFEQAKADFTYLDEQSSAQLSEKYLQLKALISDKMAHLAEQYKEQLALTKTTNDLSELRERLKDVEQQVNLLLSSNDSQFESQVKILTGAVESTKEELEVLSAAAKTAAHNQLFKDLQKQIAKMQASLHDLPAVIEVSQQAQVLTNQLYTLIEPYAGKDKLENDQVLTLENDVNEVKSAFNRLKTENNVLPGAKIKEFTRAVSQASKQLKLFKDYFRNIERKCENKLKVVDRMIAEGKFKSAISTFYHVQKLIDNLPQSIEETSNTRLAKAYANTSEEVQKLQDWQAYIAQPRKPALLEETVKLAEQPMDDAYARVDTVKQLRAQWQSFGMLHTAEDDNLNKAFDEAIEKAFAPCRSFFAELDKTREENLSLAKALIDEAASIDEDTAASELISIVGSLRKRFARIGEIDKTELRKVKRQFSKVIEPLNKRINQFYADNASQKQKLVDKATRLSANDDDSLSLKEATQQAKNLQQQWKTIGFAGKNQENQLWQAFREQNDQLFMRYHEHLSARQEQSQEVLQSLETKVAEIDKKIRAAKSLPDLSFYNDELVVLNELSGQLDEKTLQKVKSKLGKLDESFAKESQKIDSAKANQETLQLFDFLKEYTQADMPDSFNLLTSRYKAWIKGDNKVIGILQGLSRDELVQVALIVSDKKQNDITFIDENRRKELQMLLMASKLEGNELVSAESVLAAWVSQKQVNTEDIKGLLVLEKLFTSSL